MGTLRVRPSSFRHRVVVGANVGPQGDGDITSLVQGGLITKSLQDPMGVFTLHLLPQVSNGRVTGLGVPKNSYIEIRLGRDDDQAQPPLVLRGLTSTDGGHATMEQNTPQRMSVLAGNDLGKLWKTRQVFIGEFGSTNGRNLDSGEYGAHASAYNQMLLDLNAGITDMPSWMDRFINLVFKSDLAGMLPVVNTAHFALHPYIALPDYFAKLQIPSQLTVANFAGSLWELFTKFMAPPLTEIYLVDLEDITHVVWRWTPYRNAYGNFPIIPTTSEPWVIPEGIPEPVAISLDDVLAYELGSSDIDRRTIFHTIPFIVTGGEHGTNLAAEDPTGGIYKNPYYDRQLASDGTTGGGVGQFGFRLLEVELPYLPVNPDPNVVTESCRIANGWLVETLAFCDQLEQGTITIIGNPHVRIGQELTLTEWGMRYYVEAVTQRWQVSPPKFWTEVTVTRGMPVGGLV